MGGRSTAGEFAWHAGVSAQTTSGHLGKLAEAELVVVARQGRHRYHRLASAEVAHALEALSASWRVPAQSGIGLPGRATRRCGWRAGATIISRAGSAWAGREPVRAGPLVIPDARRALPALTGEGGRFLADAFGIDLGPTAGRRPLCRTCVDWSERLPHLAGRLGAAIVRPLA